MPQGKHMKTILEVPAGVLVKHESSLGETCAVSPYPSAEPPSNLHTSPRLSITLRCPVSILVPRGWRKTIPVLSPSQTTWAPAGVLGPAVLQGLRETTLWEPRGQAGRQAHGEGGQASGAQLSSSINARKPQ